MKLYKVIEILDKPYHMKMRIDDKILKDWGVSVTLQSGDDVHDSTVTFETEEEAQNLKVGDTFYR